MVGEGLGIILLPDLVVDAGVLTGQQVATARLPDTCPRHVMLAWRKTAPKVPLFRKLGANLTEARRAIR